MTKNFFNLNTKALKEHGWLQSHLQQCASLKNATMVLLALVNIPTTGESLTTIQSESGLSASDFKKSITELIRVGIISCHVPKQN